MSKTKIDWTDETINPFTGCNGPHGTRCSYCYAQKMAKRLAGMPGGEKYRRVAKHSDGDPFVPAFHVSTMAEEMERLRRARKSRRVFVGSMGEMCFNGRALYFDENGDRGCDVISMSIQNAIAHFCAGLPKHTFQILTKRPDLLGIETPWPSNVHLGVSVSTTDDSHRIATLLDKKAVGVAGIGGGRWHPHMALWASVEPLLDKDFEADDLRGLDWVVIGAETGTGKPSSHEIVEAAKWIVHCCGWHNTPCFVKDNMRQADLGYDWPREFPK